MLIRYNLALLPHPSLYGLYQRYAQLFFTPIQAGYLLGENSLPHITICQFECDDLQTVEAVKSSCTSLSIPPFEPTFLGLSILPDRRLREESHWIQLLVLREQRLVELHQRIKQILQRTGLSCLNSHGELYRPHLTLACVHLPEPFTFTKWPFEFVGKSPHAFCLSLGQGDNYGQFIKLLFTV